MAKRNALGLLVSLPVVLLSTPVPPAHAVLISDGGGGDAPAVTETAPQLSPAAEAAQERRLERLMEINDEGSAPAPAPQPAPQVRPRRIPMGILRAEGITPQEWLDAESNPAPPQPSQPAPLPQQPPSIPQLVQQYFGPMGPAFVAWANCTIQCESGGDPTVCAGHQPESAGGACGLFQFEPATWAKTPEGSAGLSRLTPAASIGAAAFLLKSGDPRTVAYDTWVKWESCGCGAYAAQLP